MFWLEDGVWGVRGEASVVDKVMLSKSIMSCSLVLTGAGGSGRANALLMADVEAAGVDVELLTLTIARPSVVPLEVLCGAVDIALECLRASCANSSSSSSSS